MRFARLETHIGVLRRERGAIANSFSVLHFARRHRAALSPKPGTGVLNNELYIGRLIWNRLRYVKNPDTGKRISRLKSRMDHQGASVSPDSD